MNRSAFAPVIFALSCLLLVSGDLSAQSAFTPGCPPPFTPLPSARPVDVSCGNEGVFNETPTDANRAQNRAKNSFCAKGANGNVGADPIVVTVTAFDLLQDKVVENGIDFGTSANLPEDRDALKNIATNAAGGAIGEGSYVVFVGFMLNAHPASKESVSCQKGTVGFLDIHMSLARAKNADLCRSVTAEIIPHSRPSLWPRIYYAEHYEELQKQPLRLKGHLFFDGSHHACGDPEMTNRHPLRRSIWGIHPVYSIDVCSNTSLSERQVDNEAVWTSFDGWIVSQ